MVKKFMLILVVLAGFLAPDSAYAMAAGCTTILAEEDDLRQIHGGAFDAYLASGDVAAAPPSIVSTTTSLGREPRRAR